MATIDDVNIDKIKITREWSDVFMIAIGEDPGIVGGAALKLMDVEISTPNDGFDKIIVQDISLISTVPPIRTKVDLPPIGEFKFFISPPTSLFTIRDKIRGPFSDFLVDEAWLRANRPDLLTEQGVKGPIMQRIANRRRKMMMR
jgi:hypothetical protein